MNKRTPVRVDLSTAKKTNIKPQVMPSVSITLQSFFSIPKVKTA